MMGEREGGRRGREMDDGREGGRDQDKKERQSDK